MPVFTAIATGVAAVATAVGFGAAAAATIGAVGAFAARTLLTIGISKLLANRSTNNSAQGAGNAGARVQLPPATNNKLPIVYGTAYVAPTITDAKISEDQKTMWYVCALSEANGSQMSFGDIYYDGKLVTFDATDQAKVVSLTTNSDPVQVDTKISGNLYIYLFANGSNSGVNTGGDSAIDILSDPAIASNYRWTSTDLMTDCAFVIVKVIYNQDADTTNLGQLNVELTNTTTKPGDVILDYLTNERYGCAIPAANIDTASLIALNTYSDELITYTPVGGGSATQARYRINGPVNTGQNCLSNLQDLCDACDSWLQYSELTGEWKVVINQAYTDYTTTADLYHVNSDVLIGGIDINPIDLNASYNSIEVEYPNTHIKDQTDYKVFNLSDYQPNLLSPNEAENRLSVSFPQVNNYIQAAYLGIRRLLQSREDLTITFSLDYSGIQLEAGDVIRVTLEEYGWDVQNGGLGKTFRVSQVQEVKDESGFLGARITAFEYNGTVYADNALNDFIPEANTGLTDPNILDTPGTPVVSTNPLTYGVVKSFNVASVTPAVGLTMYMDFNYGSTSDTSLHKLYKTVQTSDGAPFDTSDPVSIDITDLPPGTYYWSVTARTETTGSRSGSSTSYYWGGPNITNYDPSTGNGGINYDQINSDVFGISRPIGGNTFKVADAVANTIVTPVSVTSTSTRNIPVYIPGTALSSSSHIYPFFTGTSSSSAGTNGNNYYSSSSTGTMNPAGSAILLVADGEDNWYKILYDDFSANTVKSYESYAINAGYQVVSDGNAVVQVGLAYKSGTNTYYELDTQTLNTINLTTNMPVIFDYRATFSGNTNNITGGAVFVRNTTSGTNAYIILGSIASAASKKEFF